MELTKGSSSEARAFFPGWAPKKGTSDALVKFNPNQQGKVTTKDLTTKKISDKATPSHVIFAHELIHADRDMRGESLSTSATEIRTYVDQNRVTQTEQVSKEEMATVGLGHNTADDITENQIRIEHTNDERVSYEP